MPGNLTRKQPVILVCDDHALLREGLCSLLSKKSRVYSCDEEEFPVQVKKTKPDLVIIDYVLEKTNGIALFQRVRQAGYRGRALILSNVEEPLLHEKAEIAGFDGYISKREKLKTIESVVLRVLNGEQVFLEPREIKSKINATNPFNVLTQREIQVVQALATTKTYAEAAQKLQISVRTFQKHRENISAKLGNTSKTELIRMAFLWNIVNDPGIISAYK